MAAEPSLPDKAPIDSQELRSLVTNLPGVLWRGDRQGRTLFISENVLGIYGYTAQEICESDQGLWLGRIHAEDVGRVREAYESLFSQGRPYDIEYRIQRRDGRWIWLHDRAVATIRKQGVLYADGLFTDVTARKAAEEELRSTEQRLRLALEAGGMGVWEWDIATGRVSWLGEAEGEHWLTRGRSEGTLESFLDFVHPADREMVRRTIAWAVAHDSVFEMEFRSQAPGGPVRWRSGKGRVFRDASDRPTRMIGVGMDITERRTAQERLAGSEAMLAEAQRLARLGSWQWDLTSDTVCWSGEMSVLFGLPPGQAPGSYEAFLQLIHPADQPFVRLAVERALRQRRPYAVEHRVIWPDGSVHLMHSRGEVVVDEHGRPTGMIGTGQDVTERRRLEQQVLEVSDREQQRIGEDLHDGLGQHLTGILFRISALQQRLAARGRGGAELSAEASEAAAITRLVQEAIGQTRELARGLHPVALETSGLPAALQQLAQQVKQIHQVPCSFALHPEYQEAVGVDHATAIHLYRIAQEAATNAAKHSDCQHIAILLRVDAEHVTLTVEDDGRGMPAESPCAGSAPSGGLGLSIMCYRANMIGANLSIGPRAEGGTVVELSRVKRNVRG